MHTTRRMSILVYIITIIFLIHSIPHCHCAVVMPTTYGATSPYYQSTNIQDAYIGKSSLTVTAPTSLVGTLVYATSPTAGPPIIATGPSYLLPLTVVLPNSIDDPLGCTPFTQNSTDTGQPLAGSLLLLLRGTCDFDVKAANAYAMGVAILAIYNCNSVAPPFCAPQLVDPTNYDEIDLPYFFMFDSDGRLWQQYLQARNNWWTDRTTWWWNITICITIRSISQRYRCY